MIPSVATLGALFCVPFLFPNIEAQLLRAASLSNAPVGIYLREGGLYGDSTYLASLGGAPVGTYSRHQNPVFLYPLARAPVVFPSHRRPIRPRPRPPVKPPVRRVPTLKVPSKPTGVSGRVLGGLFGGIIG